MRYVLVKQQDETDCGLACISTISEFYGKKISITKIRKELFLLEKNATIQELEKQKETQSLEIKLLQEKLLTDTTYLHKLETELKTENLFRSNRKELYEKNIITQTEYAQGETLYHINYISTFWDVISTKLQLIYFSDQKISLLNHFLGNFLYETF